MSDVVATVIHPLSGESVAVVHLRCTATVLDLKLALQKHVGVPRFCQRLLLRESVLSDSNAMQSLDEPLTFHFIKLAYSHDSEDLKRFHAAVHAGNAAEVEELLRVPLDPNHSDTLNQPTALMTAVTAGPASRLDIVQLLCDARANLNEVCKVCKLTPLMSAVQARRLVAVRILCACGADKDASLPDGRTALSFAARSENTDIVRLLCVARADVNREAEHSMTPLQIALEFGQYDSAKELRALGADRLSASRACCLLLQAVARVRIKLLILVILLTVLMLATFCSRHVGEVPLAEVVLGTFSILCGLTSLVLYMALTTAGDFERFPHAGLALCTMLVFLPATILGMTCSFQAWDDAMRLWRSDRIQTVEAGVILAVAGASSMALPSLVLVLFVYRTIRTATTKCFGDDFESDILFDSLTVCCEIISFLVSAYCKRIGFTLDPHYEVAIVLAGVALAITVMICYLVIAGLPFFRHVATSAYQWQEAAQAAQDSAYHLQAD